MSRLTKILIYLSRFFGDFTPIVPYAAIFFSREGITLPQISFFFLVFSLTVVLLEIPTGLLADRLNRKTILIFSRCAKLACFLAWFISPTLGGFLVGFILWGIATALDSGAFQAFVYDHLENHKQRDLFAKVYGSATGWSFIGLFLSALIAALVVRWGFNVLIVITLLSLFLSLITLLFVPALSTAYPGHKKLGASMIFDSAKFIWNRKFLFTLMVIGIAAGGIKGSLEEYYPLFLESKQVALVAIGILIASFEALKSLGAFLAGYTKAMKKRQALLLGIIGVLILSSGFVFGYFVALLLAVMTIVDSMLWVFNDEAIQQAAHSRNRATLTSIKNFGMELTALCVYILFGGLAHLISLSGIFIVGGAVLLCISLILMIIFRKSSSLLPSY